MTDTSAASYASTRDAEPYSFYEALHASGGSRWDDGLDAWLIGSYAGVKQVLLQDDVAYAMPDRIGERRAAHAQWAGGPRVITMLEGDEHDRVHRWWMQALSPTHVADWRDTLIRPIIDATIDRFIGGGHAELRSELADRVPPRVIAAVMGFPWEDDDWVDELTRLNLEVLKIFAAHAATENGGDRAAYERTLAATLDAARQLDELMLPYVEERASGEGTDVISMLWRDGPRLLDDWGTADVLANARMMYQGGAETATHAIAGAMFVLLGQPELREEVRSGEQAASRFVEEVIRLYGPVHFRSRQALSDQEVDGCPIAHGQAVIPLVAAANRDPSRYECPGEVRLDRTAPRDHFGFHFGARYCVGSALARAEVLECVDAALGRFGDMRLAEGTDEPRMAGWLLRSYGPLPVTFTPGPITEER
jgi:cytochrome P450